MSRSTIILDGFAHRNNDDGTVDAICLQCFLTVATKASEDGLREYENHHDCERLAMEKMVANLEVFEDGFSDHHGLM